MSLFLPFPGCHCLTLWTAWSISLLLVISFSLFFFPSPCFSPWLGVRSATRGSRKKMSPFRRSLQRPCPPCKWAISCPWAYFSALYIFKCFLWLFKYFFKTQVAGHLFVSSKLTNHSSSSRRTGNQYGMFTLEVTWRSAMTVMPALKPPSSSSCLLLLPLRLHSCDKESQFGCQGNKLFPWRCQNTWGRAGRLCFAPWWRILPMHV